ncbi:MAG TPA: DUF1844 domain-containing protein [Thermoanaerobaculia bacterium]|nr:DUF1844 domain-containing protein [Thermoanaerobaculia bacterium]
MSERDIKIIDKRIFLPDGSLREEYRFLEDEASAPAVSAPAEPPPPAAPAPEPAGELDPFAPEPGGPGFFHLLEMIAGPISIYLGDAPLPGGHHGEDLEMARLHIELLSVLKQKTAGNLSAREAAVLEDLIYRFRMRYVQKQG